MELLFLDIDGTINTASTRKQFHNYRENTDEVKPDDYFRYGIDDNKLELLEEFYKDRPSLHTIISSDWRNVDILDLEDFQNHFDLRVIGKTARGRRSFSISRQQKIPRDQLILNKLSAMDENPDAWVVLDDDPEPLTDVMDHAIITNSIEGLTKFTIQDIRNTLNNQLDTKDDLL